MQYAEGNSQTFEESGLDVWVRGYCIFMDIWISSTHFDVTWVFDSYDYLISPGLAINDYRGRDSRSNKSSNMIYLLDKSYLLLADRVARRT